MQECDQFHPDLPCEPREARNHNSYCVTVSRVRTLMCATRMTDVRCPVPCGLIGPWIGREAHEPREGTREGRIRAWAPHRPARSRETRRCADRADAARIALLFLVGYTMLSQANRC